MVVNQHKNADYESDNVKDKDINYLFWDIGVTSNHNDTWYNTGLTLTRQLNGTLITCTQTWKKIYPISDDTFFDRPFVLEFDIVDIVTQVVMNYTNGTTTKEEYLGQTGHYKYSFNSNGVTKQKDYGNIVNLTNVTGALRIGFILGLTTHSVKLANLKAYLI